MNEMQPFGAAIPISHGPLDARLAFLRQTYMHLAGAVGLFLAMAWFMVTSGLAGHVLVFFRAGKLGMVMYVGAFILRPGQAADHSRIVVFGQATVAARQLQRFVGRRALYDIEFGEGPQELIEATTAAVSNTPSYSRIRPVSSKTRVEIPR